MDAQATGNAHYALALLRQLLDGVPRFVIVSPGSRSTPLVLAAASLPQAQVIPVLDERMAGFVALGLAKASGRAPILICTSGSAGGHYLPAVMEAYHSRTPLYVLTADRPARLQQRGAAQTTEQGALFGAHVRFAATLPLAGPSGGAAEEILRPYTHQAAQQAEGSYRGPVHLNVPFEEPLWAPGTAYAQPSAAPADTPVHSPHASYAPLVSETSAAAALPAAALAAFGRRGLFVAGPLPWHAHNEAKALLQLAAQLRWPVLADGASPVRQRPGGWLGKAEHILACQKRVAALQPQVIVQWGSVPTSKQLQRALQTWTQGAEASALWLLDAGGAWLDPSGRAQGVLRSTPSALLAQLAALAPRPADAVAAQQAACWQQWEGQLDAVMAGEVAAEAFEGSVALHVWRSLPPSSSLFVGSGLAVRDVDAFSCGPSRGAAVVVNRGLNGIDGNLATALGVSLGSGRAPTVALLGDLAFCHDLAALHLINQLRAPLCLVVVDNGGGAIFDSLPIADHPQHYVPLFRTPQTLDIGKLALACGLCYKQLAAAQLPAALAQWAARPQPTVLHVPLGAHTAALRARLLARLQAALSPATF